MPKDSRQDESKLPDIDVYIRWRELVNMSSGQVKSFLESPTSKMEGFDNVTETDKKRLRIARQNAKRLLKMIPRSGSFRSAERQWTPSMWMWARRQIRVISRLLKSGGFTEGDDAPTKKMIIIKLWGHNPLRPTRQVPKLVLPRITQIAPETKILDLQNKNLRRAMLRVFTRF